MNMIKSYSAWRKYRETYSALSRLSERELSDIGMARKELRHIARRAV